MEIDIFEQLVSLLKVKCPKLSEEVFLQSSVLEMVVVFNKVTLSELGSCLQNILLHLKEYVFKYSQTLHNMDQL